MPNVLEINCTTLINRKRGYHLNKIMDENKIEEMMEKLVERTLLIFYWKKKMSKIESSINNIKSDINTVRDDLKNDINNLRKDLNITKDKTEIELSKINPVLKDLLLVVSTSLVRNMKVRKKN